MKTYYRWASYDWFKLVIAVILLVAFFTLR
jgi:hypothetical protein